jgi:hypothetical protein
MLRLSLAALSRGAALSAARISTATTGFSSPLTRSTRRSP